MTICPWCYASNQPANADGCCADHESCDARFNAQFDALIARVQAPKEEPHGHPSTTTTRTTTDH